MFWHFWFQTDRWHSVISMECCSLLLFFFSWPRLYFCLSAISTTVFDVIVCLVFVSSRFDILKKRVLKVNCVPIFYSFKTPKKRRQMPSWVVACYKQLNQSLLRDFLYKLMLANLWVYTVWILTCKEKQDMYVFLHYDICKVQ